MRVLFHVEQLCRTISMRSARVFHVKQEQLRVRARSQQMFHVKQSQAERQYVSRGTEQS
jgi:hypothetical protein